MNTYQCLVKQRHYTGNYELIPIQEEDMQLIKNWRNSQIDVLRQKFPLTEKEQINYYKNVIRKTFDQKNPDQILFSFLFEKKCIGYGGLVHIDWESKKAEVSFLAETERGKKPKLYQRDLRKFLKLISIVAFEEIGFKRLVTETFDIRSDHISILEKFGFKLEERKIQQILIRGKNIDSLIHEYPREKYVKG